MLSLLLTLSAFAGTVPFHPGSGPETVAIDAQGRINGTPVQLTGTVLVRATDPDALAALPGVAFARQRAAGVVELTPVAGLDPTELSNQLHARDDVRWAHPDLRVPIVRHYRPNDPYLGDQWHLENTGQRGYVPGADVNAVEAWELTAGAGQIVAIIDTGIDPTHPDLDVIMGWDYVDGDSDSTPHGDDAHGTACAGLAAGIGDNGSGITGVAYEAQAYSIRFIGDTSMADMYDAFVEAVDAGAGVLSNSWGYEGCPNIPMYSVIIDAMEYADQNGRDGRGTAVVFSSGNDNCDITDDGLQEHPVVTSVAASSGYDVKEGYSSWGPWLDITAPSSRIVTTDIVGSRGYNGFGNDYTDTFNGTSASAPQIAGVFALMFAANERLTGEEARETMCATAVRLDPANGDYDADGWSPYYGCGRVDAGAAVRAVYNQGPPEAPVPLSPDSTAVVGDVTLQWSKALDPDDDRVSYKVRYTLPEVEGFQERTQDTEDRWFDIPEDFAKKGVLVSWRVRASDQWGAGEWSPDTEFRIVAAPSPAVVTGSKGGCSTAPTAPSWLFLPLLALFRRYRR